MNKTERRGPRTPRSNELEAARLAMKLPRTPTYDSALKLCRHLEAELQQAQSRIAELEQRSADTERLDWMDKDAGEQVYSVGTTWYARSACGRPHHKQKDLRAAIDTARGLLSEPQPDPQLQQAAPELLEALKALLNQTNSFELAHAYGKARVAIAKAEGRP